MTRPPALLLRNMLSRRPYTMRQLIRRTGCIGLVAVMREINDTGAADGPIVAARGTNEMGGVCQVYWIRPQRMGAAWKRRLAKFNVNPNDGEVV